ncbi:hypothetical protein ZEAMMB73_Zm00001d052382 [Zea mays]|uniref:Uncharacterized protein n=1 Tax=Zea mays TaxID=4577 RepID=A0A1D6QGT6_MAIZE|nr:hypothetical protein ZEAMMB73_Zm00001d052382 [Zea mays]
MAKKLSRAAVLLLVAAPLFKYLCAVLVGIQVGRALERCPESARFSLGETLHYVTKLWDGNVLGGRRGGGTHSCFTVSGAESSSSEERPYAALASADGVRAPRTNSDANVTQTTTYTYYNHTSPRGVISVGPWGGSGGQPFYMRGASAPRLRSVVLYHSGAIHSLAYEYTLAGDYDYEGPPRRRRVAGPWGLPHSYGSRGVRAEIDLRSGEHVTAVEGTTGHFADVPGVVVTSLTFRTSAGRTYGPYGSVGAGSHRFSVPAADGARIVGFWGRSGWLLDAVGVYMKPPPCSSSDTAAYEKHASRRQRRN